MTSCQMFALKFSLGFDLKVNFSSIKMKVSWNKNSGAIAHVVYIFIALSVVTVSYFHQILIK